jgi:tripartite-type tricarboxylate transporter receptor subunit TctC
MKLLIAVYLFFISVSVFAAEIITVVSPYTARHQGHAAIYKILEKANANQNKYRFILDLKPGAAGVTALRNLDNSHTDTIGIIHASFVQNSLSGLINEENYIPISSLGDACWFIVSKVGNEQQGLKSLIDVKENLIFGGVGVGSASHLTVIEISQLINRPIQFVPFQSAADAGVLLLGNHEINMAIMPMNEFTALNSKNNNLKRLAIHCNRRHPEAKWVSTTREQGVLSPYVINTFVVHKNMPSEKQKELSTILDQSIVQVGADTILDISAFHPPVFDNIPVTKYHNHRITILKNSIKKHQVEIEKFITGKQ